MGLARFSNPDYTLGLLKRLIVPVALGVPMAFMMWDAVQKFEFRALLLFLVSAVFMLLSLAFRRFERAVFGMIFILTPINVDINFEIGPTLYSLGLPQGTTLLNLSVIDLAILLLYPMWIIRLMTNRMGERIIWPAASTPFLLFTAWGALSILNAPNQMLAGIEVVCFLKVFLSFFYIANNIKTREDMWYVVKCLGAGLFFQSFICCAQQVKQGNIGLGVLGERKVEKVMAMGGGVHQVFRVGGTLGHPTFLGGYLAVMLPVALAAALESRKGIRKVIATGIFLLGVLVLIFSYCRSAWIVTAISCPLLLLRWYRYYLRDHKFNLGPILAIFVVGLCVLAPFYPKIYARLSDDDKGSTESRIPQWKMGMNMVKAHPLLGVGLNNYNVVSDLYEPYVADESTKTRVFYFGTKIHNLYLGVAAQAGLVGLALYLCFLWSLLTHGWKKMKTVEDPAVRSFFCALVLGLGAMFIHESFHTGNISQNMSLWIPASILACAGFAPPKIRKAVHY